MVWEGSLQKVGGGGGGGGRLWGLCYFAPPDIGTARSKGNGRVCNVKNQLPSFGKLTFILCRTPLLGGVSHCSFIKSQRRLQIAPLNWKQRPEDLIKLTFDLGSPAPPDMHSLPPPDTSFYQLLLFAFYS